MDTLNLTFPVARYGVGLSFREVFGIEFCDTPQLAAGSFIGRSGYAKLAIGSVLHSVKQPGEEIGSQSRYLIPHYAARLLAIRPPERVTRL